MKTRNLEFSHLVFAAAKWPCCDAACDLLSLPDWWNRAAGGQDARMPDASSMHGAAASYMEHSWSCDFDHAAKEYSLRVALLSTDILSYLD